MTDYSDILRILHNADIECKESSTLDSTITVTGKEGIVVFSFDDADNLIDIEVST